MYSAELQAATRDAVRRQVEALRPRPAPLPLSLARALLAASEGRGLQPEDSLEGQTAAACAELDGRAHSPHVFRWPLAALDPARRDLTVAGSLAGGALVGVTTGEPSHPLAGWLPVRAGVNVQLGLVGDALAPRILADPEPTWLASEGAQTPETQPTLGASVLQPKTVAVYLEASRQLALQAPTLESTLRTSVSRALELAALRAIVHGSGASGEPTGLANTAGVGTASGSGLSWGDVVDLASTIVAAGVPADEVAVIAGRGAFKTLSKRERATGSGQYIWQDNRVAGMPAFVTRAVDLDTLAVGWWPGLTMAVWGVGVEFSVNPVANFQAGIIGFRAALEVDVAVQRPEFFSIVTGVS